VTDVEYDAHYEAIVSAVKNAVREGVVIELPTVPHQLLRDAPLVDGDWIDRYVVELAEWGTRLVEKGYLPDKPEDQHPLAWHRTIDLEGGCEADAAVTGGL
jgi:hypothetical protein